MIIIAFNLLLRNFLTDVFIVLHYIPSALLKLNLDNNFIHDKEAKSQMNNQNNY